MKPYLCGPINGCTDTEANDWRGRVIAQYPESINPMVRDYRGQEDVRYQEIVILDKRDIHECSVVLVNYTKPSVGTSMEVLYAWTIGKPVILWCDAQASLSPWLRFHATTIVHSFQDAMAAIERML